MPKPDAKQHNPAPTYLRSLVERSGLSQRKAAECIGITDRVMRYYLSDESSETFRPAPYTVQFALECLLTQSQLRECRKADAWGAGSDGSKP